MLLSGNNILRYLILEQLQQDLCRACGFRSNDLHSLRKCLFKDDKIVLLEVDLLKNTPIQEGGGMFIEPAPFKYLEAIF